MTTMDILVKAKAAAPVLTQTDTEQKNRALYAMAESLEAETDAILQANILDMEAAHDTISPVMMDRLALSPERIRAMAGVDCPVIRLMPNTPVQVGKGMTLYCCNDLVEDDVLEDFLEDMTFTGRMDEIAEHLIDSAGVVSGCGPAYMYMFAEALADGAVACGVPRAKALEYAAATLAGAGEILLQTGEHPGKLKDNVCSPGGSTIAGLNVLEQRAFRGAVMDCVKAAYKRNQELGK